MQKQRAAAVRGYAGGTMQHLSFGGGHGGEPRRRRGGLLLVDDLEDLGP